MAVTKIDIPTNAYYLLQKVYGDGKVKGLYKDFLNRGITISEPTLDKLKQGIATTGDTKLLEQIINAYHLPAAFFIDKTYARFCGEGSIIAEEEWHPVHFRVKDLVIRALLQNNSNKSATINFLGIHRTTLDKYLALTTLEYPKTTLEKFLNWCELLKVNYRCFIDDTNTLWFEGKDNGKYLCPDESRLVKTAADELASMPHISDTITDR